MIKMTRDLAFAASWDAANRNIKKNKRKKWNKEDYNVGVEVYDKLWPLERGILGEGSEK